MALIDVRTVTITGKGQIAIPKNTRKLAGFAEGAKIAVLTFDDHLELRPMTQVSGMLAASEKTLARDWLSKEEERAWKHLRKGRS